MKRRPVTIGLATFLLVVPSAARAQGWTLDAYAGRAIYDPVSASVGSNHGVLGLRYAGMDGRWFFVSAAAPLAAEDPVWGAAGLGRRFVFADRRFAVGGDLGFHGHAFQDPSSSEFGAGATIEALPFVAVQRGPARLELRSGLLQYVSTYGGQSGSRTLHDSRVRLSVGGFSPLDLDGEARYVRAEEGGYTYAGASASWNFDRAQVWASAGRWLSDALPEIAWNTGASLRFGPRFEVWASIGHETSDPLYWNAPRRSWNIGMSRRLGGDVQMPLPIPAEVSAGRVTLRIRVDDSPAQPYIVGDFTGWRAVAMVRSGECWTAHFDLDPGVYYYAFRTADGEWFVPESVPGRRDDGFGGSVAVLLVP